MSLYQERISALTDQEPRYVEAWMRLEHGTLDALTPERFESEVCIANACIAASTVKQSEELARSYGL